MNIKRIHHVAYRCKNARDTVEFYQEMLGMDFVLAIAEDQLPSTKAPDPYMHVFLDACMGNVLAFFELPNSPEMGFNEQTPDWVQHLALELDSHSELMEAKARLEAGGLDVMGLTDHGIFQSICFRDPNGHRIELATNTGSEAMIADLHEVAPAMLEEWDRTKKAPRHAVWLHKNEFLG